MERMVCLLSLKSRRTARAPPLFVLMRSIPAADPQTDNGAGSPFQTRRFQRLAESNSAIVAPMRKLPPLKALRAFEAAARHMSFKAAADELSFDANRHQPSNPPAGDGCWAKACSAAAPAADPDFGRCGLFPGVRDGFDTIAEAFAGAQRGCLPHSKSATAVAAGLPRGTSQPSADRVARPHLRPALSLVVLPFANIGGDHEQEYFADGITESLTTRSFAHFGRVRDRP